ncbi:MULTISPECIES: ATP-dependent zinc metalloprotease FtsH [Tissierella]|uniref:ATP-dependent zinc metalloprotease FtsH n=1 Tax=Tissierella praeacuta DSM 18095 TaxID=1123404 RepID=A0A1M4Z2J5_9FIRM|nr:MULTISPECIES: ATP-dependent zinc metalloprotease FtsH [Tissierella]MBU5257381.1 ATP-dependent zinc metalloprotease FtsH [Tissierella praeacuta]TCU67480.1 cell division protease FtsH [Tissierella praeacuta]SHF12293.1 cell division protease FtsH [Tissierella praeacuta DSM 18095]SUP00625.1 ATP-dependent zinc metalloprotease FtsH [Tissierella praeacuta]HAE92883.1 ATP-dependent zinc metalloprotease FtsH [Tissierella sp.]
MKKKKIIFLFLVLGLIASSILIYDGFFPTASFSTFRIRDRLAVWVITLILFILYIKTDTNPQLVPSVLSIEKDSGREKDKSDVSFKDVAGLEEIKEELQETIDFINNSLKYKKMGAKIPKGILFHGPPGTGKTLLAKAVAGETNSTFLYASGSEFVEKYVGVGAKRVRTLFERAKKEAPSIIFIDEIDAIGARRNLESNNEKDQTLNQLLVEMDGFNTDETIIVIGATNRLDLLDEALLRPGRFDRHIFVGNPNIRAREQILEVHTKNKPLDKSIDIKMIAKKTTGLSGAQLANIANEAAIIAVRKNKNIISLSEFDAAIERVLAGLEVKNPTVLKKEKETVAIHEAGHALVAKILETDIVQKISIIPRGQALGYVLKFPDEERYLLTQSELKNKITCLLAGRAAEELIFKEITTGAKDDLNKATDIAREMVCSYGMSSLGTMALDESFMRYNSDIIRIEIKKITDERYIEALKIIEENKYLLHYIANTLLEKETIDSDELDNIFKLYKKPLPYAIESN